MRTIHNHSEYNKVKQREGFLIKTVNQEAVINYRDERRVWKEVRKVWGVYRNEFIDSYPMVNKEQYSYKLGDLIDLYNVDVETVLTLEKELHTRGKEALRDYLINGLKLKGGLSDV